MVQRCAVIPETTIGGQRVPPEMGTPGKLELEGVDFGPLVNLSLLVPQVGLLGPRSYSGSPTFWTRT